VVVLRAGFSGDLPCCVCALGGATAGAAAGTARRSGDGRQWLVVCAILPDIPTTAKRLTEALVWRTLAVVAGCRGQFTTRAGGFHCKRGQEMRRTGRFPFPPLACRTHLDDVVRHLRSQYPEADNHNAQLGWGPPPNSRRMIGDSLVTTTCASAVMRARECNLRIGCTLGWCARSRYHHHSHRFLRVLGSHVASTVVDHGL
jgi:hypothetical protein